MNAVLFLFDKRQTPKAGQALLFTILLIATALAQLPPTPEKSTASADPKPQLYVEQRSRELGKILEGELVSVSWKIENRGNADLVIDRTGAACGCTVVKLRDEDKVIRPGQALDLHVEFNSTGRFGEQNKEIDVFTNDGHEPQLKLKFHALVEQLYNADPSNVVNLRVVRRGETVPKSLEILPAPQRGDLSVSQIDVQEGAPFEVRMEPFQKSGLHGVRVYLTISESAAVGPVSSSMTIKFQVGTTTRERIFSVRGEIVGDLTWLPKVLDATRQPSLPGKVLAPVTISSTDQRPFQITEATGGPLLAITVDPSTSPKPGTSYSVQVAVRADAPSGPFGTMLKIATNSLDQPVVEVPVFGIVAPKIEVEPASVYLRKDGTPSGSHRRLRIKKSDATPLTVKSVECDMTAVSVTPDRQAGVKYSHLAYFDVKLTGSLPQGTHQSVIRVTTDTAGAETIEVPVRIEVPSSGS